MNKVFATSPDIYTFGFGSTETDLEYQARLKYWDKERWKKEDSFLNNLEYSLRSSQKIIDKCKAKQYSLDLYAALCNNTFENSDGAQWECTWRYAGGVLAHLNCRGDYIDWYCSGREGRITEEILSDLLELGWKPC